jgi:hypothetical protein
VIASLSVVGEEGERSASALGERIDEAFRAAGLAGEVVLSPAQRRAAGVVARRGHFAASYTCLGGGVGGSHNRRGVAALVAVWSLQGSPTLEETRVAVPEGGLFGTFGFRGGETRSGAAENGVGQPLGYYWRRPLGQVAATSPVAWGRYLFVPASDGRLLGFEQSGRLNLRTSSGPAITSGPVVGQPLGVSPAVAVFVTAEGMIHWVHATQETVPLHSPVEVGPVETPSLGSVLHEGGPTQPLSTGFLLAPGHGCLASCQSRRSPTSRSATEW